MTIEEIKNLKDKIYELEGLLELAQLREDKIEELSPLILARLSALTEISEDEAPSDEISEDEAPSDEISKKEIPSPHVAVEPRKHSEAPITPDIAVQPRKHSEAQITPEIAVQPRKLSEAPIAPEVAVQLRKHSEAPITPEIAVQPRKLSEAQIEKKPAKAPIFCLNDRFRFKRTLFGGSETEFSSAMKTIAEMDSYEEAEQYFLESYNWEPGDQEVIDFLDILSIYYESNN